MSSSRKFFWWVVVAVMFCVVVSGGCGSSSSSLDNTSGQIQGDDTLLDDNTQWDSGRQVSNE